MMMSVSPADVQQLLVIQKEEDPHPRSSSLDQQDMELVNVKKEEDKLWTNQEGEQRTVKREDDDKPEVLQLYSIKTEDNRDSKPLTISSDPGGLDTEWKPGNILLFTCCQPFLLF